MSSALIASTPLHQSVSPDVLWSHPLTSEPSAPLPAPTQLLHMTLEALADGLILLTAQGEVITANRSARQICHHWLAGSANSRLNSGLNSGLGRAALQLPAPIWQQCQQLMQQGELMQGQRRLPEFELMNDFIHLRVRVRWIEGACTPAQLGQSPGYLLLTLEERDRSVSKVHQYNLSDREQEVWRLRMQGYSYQDIANKLYITINTVKKHMKNIRAKQRLFETVDF